MITIYQGDNTDISETMLNDYLIKNYEWALTNIEVNGISEFLKEVDNKDFKLSKYRHHGGNKYFIEGEDIFYSVFNYGGERFYLDIFAKSKEAQDKHYKKISKFLITEKEAQINRSTFYIGQNLDTREDKFILKDFEDIIEDYYPDFIDINEFIRQFLSSEESIFILSGKTGTGKSKFFTYILKFLLQNPEILTKKQTQEDEFFMDENKKIFVGYLKNENILALDQFWITLTERDYDIVILDDLDYFLSPRSKVIGSEEEIKKDKFISQLLSFTDGIVKNKTKFLISTNRDIDAVDEALLRPGRLFGIFSFNELTNEQGLAIWKKEGFTKKSFKEEFGEEHVLQSKLGSKINEYKINNGSAAKSFLKKGSTIDISAKFKKDNKIGF